jgi:hypothetical protein
LAKQSDPNKKASIGLDWISCMVATNLATGGCTQNNPFGSVSVFKHSLIWEWIGPYEGTRYIPIWLKNMPL